MKWVITGILAVSAAAALAGGTMILSNDDSEASAVAIHSKDGGETSPAEAIAKERAFMTFSNDGNKPDGGFYTTPGGCNAPRPPTVEDHRIQGASSLRFMESSYIHEVAANLEAADGKCTCELRFPSWDAAFKDMEERFMSLPDDESSEWVRDYARTDRSRLTREVDKICKVQGIY
ncbi:hypothetical protein ACFOM8_20005 [Paracoccus angustae]|uniref:Uncharacterized protein n=1 Tax=Paracoccus angustae TaxID=1671480 RepID=A0ABV7U994_9RHOB